MKIEDFDIESEFNKLRQSLIDKYNVDLKVLDVKDQIEKARLVTRASYGNPKFKNFPKNQIGNARVGTLKLVSAAGFLALLGGMAKAKMQSGNEAIVEAEKKEITETAQ